ncbi:putative metal-dependent hydrolase [Heterosigma akashiwo virus 01]|uniref:Putative metal-dependent hydrolase n=1 Tax=Heterosigma akashiwo virus 01 TaxID=97195 RepID=A0A1C9C5D8_HAV01|nr:putative metal-dependent hydrolase [Heterosigma akashiwo virus 01]AOM63501.1 putative metal-dependent hydrolase [Heterosigma akashiwo virus 01]
MSFYIIIIIISIILYVHYKRKYGTKNTIITNGRNQKVTETFVKYNNRYIYVTSNDNLTSKVKKQLMKVVDAIDSIVSYCVHNSYPDKERSKRMLKRWKTIEVKEILPDDSHIAYLVDKSRILRLCVRKNYTNGEIEDYNTMMFVVLHELAHMMSESYGHNKEFRENFLELIRVAGFLKIYTPTHYSITPVKYCGIEIYTSPCEYDRCSLKK